MYVYLKAVIWMVLQIIPCLQASVSDDRLYILPNKVTYSEAVNLCKAEGKHLVKVMDEKTNGIVYRFALNKKLDWYWLDGNDIKVEGQWVHNDGSKMTYFKWKPAQPDNFNNEDCIHGMSTENGFWNDIGCDVKMTGICFEENGADISGSIEEKKLVLMPNKANYQAATDICKAKGMSLVKVTSEEINNIVLNLALKNKLDWYWLDGNDRQVEGQWVYNDGKKLIYSKWRPGQPDNSNNEDCLHGISTEKGIWNDMRCDADLYVICYDDRPETVPEVETKMDSLAIYLTDEKITYSEAVEFCKEQNLKLIHIDNSDINNEIHQIVAKKRLGNFWIDGNDNKEPGKWMDLNGNPLKYKNFKNNEQTGKGHCIKGLMNPLGAWNQADCDSTNTVICYQNK